MMMTKSIWDVRFTKHGVAQDADEEGQWITIRGARVLVDGDGKVIGGAEGKFNGSNYVKAALKVRREKDRQISDDKSKVSKVLDFKRKNSDMSTGELRERINDLRSALPSANRILEDAKTQYGENSTAYKFAKVDLHNIEFEMNDKEDEIQARAYDDSAKRFFEDTRWNASTYGAHQKAKDILETMQGGRYMNHKIGFKEHNAMSRDYVRWRDWPKERKRLEKAGKGRDE